MAKIALVLVFSLIMVLSIRSVVGEDALSPEQINKATSAFKEATQSVSSTAGNAAENVKETTSSWTDWAKDKLRGYGFLSPRAINVTGIGTRKRTVTSIHKVFWTRTCRCTHVLR